MGMEARATREGETAEREARVECRKGEREVQKEEDREGKRKL
jgi:hypothetical protein